jgi:hypothetical protein
LPRNRFAEREVTRYQLADGEDWVEFRNALRWGEQLRLVSDTSVLDTVTATDEDGKETRRIVGRADMGIYQAQRLLAYLYAWSFVRMDDSPAPLDIESVTGLSAEVGDELDSLLANHLAAQVALKNVVS